MLTGTIDAAAALTGWAVALGLLGAALVVWPDHRGIRAGPTDAVGLLNPASAGELGDVRAVGDPQLLGVDVVRVMVLVAACLRSGSTTGAALDQVAGVERSVVATDLRQVSVALAWGMPDDQAWAGVSLAWAPLADSLELAREAGIPAYGTLTTAAEQLRRELAARQEESAARAQVMLVLPLTLAYLPAFVLTTIVPVLIGVAVTLTTN